ncbi:protein NRT1/ PTR FAMILY 5.10-like isoform X2 [Ananas comosus]|uniref:Protein NRT1/ PTR FAMILY 5.10-like isoform X2 n=1 Tax=Ananas comosus TaxID=4615 RepID=A0A6P5F6D1_ANACO|nr:protein NRT1/ PTR FAMILY 5.10-like isoform X2 [Ananas comosus]
MDPDPLLAGSEALIGVVDYRCRPVRRSSSGRWTAALFVMGLEFAVRFAYYGVSSNLITYLTGPLGQSTAAAAAAVNAWSGAASMLPLLGAFVADSFLGRYRTIVLAALLYTAGYGMLALSSTLPFLRPPKCMDSANSSTCQPSPFQVGFFYVSLYLVAFAQGGDKSCGLAFGADQFDQNEPKECASRGSFFNWWYFVTSTGMTVAFVILSYVQDNVGWGLGFGIPTIIMSFALVVFLLGTKTYRIYVVEQESPFARIGKAFVSLARSWKASLLRPREDIERQQHEGDECEQSRMEEAKRVLRLFPIWATSLVYAVTFAQLATFFTKQGRTLDRSITSSIQVPPAALQSFGSLTIMAFVPIYDRFLVPLARKFSKLHSGITTLQRVGIGMAISFISMVVAALVEMKRLQTARDFGLIDEPNDTIPMSFWWLVPQYMLIGLADVFTVVGLQEFFYDQVPDGLRSLGIALYMSILGIGSFISSVLIFVIDEMTSKNGDSWFSNNLNRAHLDYFYLLLAGLGVLELCLFLYFTRNYDYKKKIVF